jgi:lysine 2,3-aminomutase
VFKDFTPESSTNEYSRWNRESWQEQLKRSLKTEEDFSKFLSLSENEKKGFKSAKGIFNIRATPYYASLIDQNNPEDPVRKMIMPSVQEIMDLEMSQNDPLGENLNRPCERIIHRYADRVLFLVTDFCGIYCRYCTRKHFTGGGKVLPKIDEYEEALDYIKLNKGIREVILSGGDPLTLTNKKLKKILSDLDQILHVELIRVGSRMPAACPMRLDEGLLDAFKQKTPVILMSHFNHHQELSNYTQSKLRNFAENGVQIFNQMVLLNGINNSAALVYKLSRELIRCKVYPYYMFQCDPSPGTRHLQTSIQESLTIQKELWGRCSGIALPTFSVDIPSGGGKAYLTPNFVQKIESDKVSFKGFDGVQENYHNPKSSMHKKPFVQESVQKEWNSVQHPKEVYLDKEEG